jgi:YD repeat-containing protein
MPANDILSCPPRIRLLLLFLAFAGLPLAAQTGTSILSGTTPPGVEPGSPSGSYALSGFDTVNYFSGALNIRLPLVQVGGRGEAGYSMLLPIQNQRFVAVKYPAGQGPGTGYVYYADNTDWSAIRPVYSPGTLTGRMELSGTCKLTTDHLLSLTRLTFTEADGTEYELHDQSTDGNKLTFYCDHRGAANRGTVFVSANGEAMTFVSDSAIIDDSTNGPPLGALAGTLFFRDGRNYRIEASQVTRITDRNGNQTAFLYDGSHRLTSVTDPLGRVITLVYGTGSVEIQLPRSGETHRSVYVNSTSLSSALLASRRSGQSTGYTPGPPMRTYDQLFPGILTLNTDQGNGTVNDAQVNPTVVSSVVLPNGTQYTFSYNPYGEVEQIVLPTGGAIEYEYEFGTSAGWHYVGLVGPASFNYMIYRRVKARRVYQLGSTLESTLAVTAPYYTAPIPNPPATFAVNVTVAGSGGTVQNETHTFYSEPEGAVNIWQFGSSGWEEGKETQTDTKTPDGASTLRTVANTWQQGGHVSWFPGTSRPAWQEPARDPRIMETDTTLGGLVSKETYAYDQYSNKTDVSEYDYGASTPTRHTVTVYLTSGYDTAGANGTGHLRSLPCQITVYKNSGTGTPVAETENIYDATVGSLACTAGGLAVSPFSGVSGHDDTYHGIAFFKRGNLTGVRRSISGTGTGLSVSTSKTYDIAGNALTAVDGKGQTTTYSYADHFAAGAPSGTNTRAFVTQVTLPTVSSGTYSTSAEYAYYLGSPTQFTDVNGVETAYSYSPSDPFDRLSLVSAASNTVEVSNTNYSYCDPGQSCGNVPGTASPWPSNSVLAVADVGPNAQGTFLRASHVTINDALGRQAETRAYEGGSGYISVQKQYDGLGRVAKQSNPFRTGDPVWTTTLYDGLGRPTTTTTPDGAVTSTAYTSNQATTTDPASKVRTSVTDALGRLTSVTEQLSPATTTNYRYDALDDLLGVCQGGSFNGSTCSGSQVRSFLENFSGPGDEQGFMALWKTCPSGVKRQVAQPAVSTGERGPVVTFFADTDGAVRRMAVLVFGDGRVEVLESKPVYEWPDR